MGNTLNPFAYSSKNSDDKEEKEEEKIFPQGTKYEEELNSNFKYFNVFWYDPNRDNDFDCFKKCFENVQFLKSYDLESTINFLKKNQYLNGLLLLQVRKEKN